MWVVVQGMARDLADATTCGIAGARACAAGAVRSTAVRVVHWCGSVDGVFFAVGVGEIRGPQGVDVDAGRLRERREGSGARVRSREWTGG